MNLVWVFVVIAVVAALATCGVLIWVAVERPVCHHSGLCNRELLYVGYPSEAHVTRLYGAGAGGPVPAAVVVGIDPAGDAVVTLGRSYTAPAKTAHPNVMQKLHAGEALDFTGNLTGQQGNVQAFRLHPHATDVTEATLELFPDAAHAALVPLRLMRAEDVARIVAAV